MSDNTYMLYFKNGVMGKTTKYSKRSGRVTKTSLNARIFKLSFQCWQWNLMIFLLDLLINLFTLSENSFSLPATYHVIINPELQAKNPEYSHVLCIGQSRYFIVNLFL